ncbi:nucleotidyltransferase family protein [Shouchella patagoniensis]|uniref:nucleotidyltransferase family protein n=1 Tax=Shouchella patagoniensis TaxID=228576 RepID=UPI0034634DFE
MLKSKDEIIEVIKSDELMMHVLRIVQSLCLPEWWIAAGFVRSKVWDVQHGFLAPTPLPDVDVIYFDQVNKSETKEKKWERQLAQIEPNVPWSVKNQARMHLKNNLPPYTSSIDAIASFPETATAVVVTLSEEGNVVLTAPWGVEDLLQLRVKPTPLYQSDERRSTFFRRVAQKDWVSTWKMVQVDGE